MEKTILVVEDFETSAFVLKTTLEGQGFNIIVAEDGFKALDELNGQNIDLLISDYHMPKMNGIELIEIIKKRKNYQKMPIFILSTDSSFELKNKAKKIGVTAWIKKPFKFEQLTRLINRVIYDSN
ncbi:MAG: response regulator [Bacteroidota bacterium]|nr:response regulator [Bacteroidota bacterium]